MCGIFGIVGNLQDAPQKVFLGLSDIEYRGYDSWGLAYPSKEKFAIQKEVGFLPKRLNLPLANLAIGHTRWATHGGVTKENAHPHLDCSKKLAIIHNGIIENFAHLKKSLKNHKFISNTDTEVAVHLLEEAYLESSDLKIALGKVFRQLEGLNALVATDGEYIAACKVGSPLVVGKLRTGGVIASDPNAILPLTNELFFLEDNQLVVIDKQVEIFSVKNLKQLDLKPTKVSWSYSQESLKNYQHFMLKEIHEQPMVLKNIVQNPTPDQKAAELIKKAFGTYFIGCGTASYACLAGVYLFSKIAKKHVNFSVGSEFSYLQDFLTPKSLIIAVSQSGESIDTLEPVNFARDKKSKIVSLVNVLGSSLYRVSDYPVLLGAGVEKGVASTKALIAMLAHIILLSYGAAGDLKAGVEVVEKSSEVVKTVLERKTTIQKLAAKIYKAEDIYILGRGLSYPVALEASLKIKEISYIHSEGFAGGELKHGVIALIEKGTPVLVFAPNDETRNGILANAMEVKSRGAFVIGVGEENDSSFDFFFPIKDCGASSIIPHIVFSQLLAYYLALKLKRNPDRPRNLAKSVVVR